VTSMNTMSPRVRAVILTLCGVAVFTAAFVVTLTLVGCQPAVRPHSQQTARGDASVPVTSPSCAPETAPAVMCDRVTPDGKHECAICVEKNCYTMAGIYCTASCDACAPRARKP
jgi:hypothetical protein